MSFEKAWLAALQKTIFYKLGAGNGDCNVHGECDADLLYLKRWQSRQRNSFKNRELSPSKVMALHFSGFIFDLADEKWDTIFKRIVGKQQVLSKKEKAWLKLQNDYFESGLLAVRRCLLLKNANLLESAVSLVIKEQATAVESGTVITVEPEKQAEWYEMFDLAQQRQSAKEKNMRDGEEEKDREQREKNVRVKVADWLQEQTYLFVEQSDKTFDKDMKEKFVSLWPKEKELVESLIAKHTKRSAGDSGESDEDNAEEEDGALVSETTGRDSNIQNHMDEDDETGVSEAEDGPKETKSVLSKKRMRDETASTDDETAPKRVSFAAATVSPADGSTLATLRKHSASPALTTDLFEILRTHDLHENTAELLGSLRVTEKAKLMSSLSIGQSAALRVAFGIKL